MLIRDTIRCFAQIERSKILFPRSLESQSLIRRLVLPTDELPRAVKPEKFTLKAIEDTLLYEHHTSRLDGNDARCLERFRYSNDPNGSFLTGFEETQSSEELDILESPARHEVFPVRKIPFEAMGPFRHDPLSIAAKSFSCGPRTMRWNDTTIEDILIYGLESIIPQQATYAFKPGRHVMYTQGRVSGAYILLTLKVSIDRSIHSTTSAVERNLREHQSDLTYREDGWDRWILQ